jgi:hypothetical protein
MTTTRRAESTINARSLLLPYLLAVVGGVLAIQAVIGVQGGEITVLAGAMTAVLAAAAAGFVAVRSRALRQVRFGLLVAHVGTFVPVVAGFTLHGLVRATDLARAGGGADLVGAEMLGTPWFGVVYVMTPLWGLGLLCHVVATVAQRGWES